MPLNLSKLGGPASAGHMGRARFSGTTTEPCARFVLSFPLRLVIRLNARAVRDAGGNHGPDEAPSRPPSAAAASREGDESDASGDTNVLPSSPESEMSLSDDGGKEDASDPPTTAEFLPNDLGMRMPELTDVLHEVKTDQHSIQTLRYSVHFKEEKSQKIFFEGGPAVE
ncbi:hypothetical protein THAOC_02195 [Thalassiosira oceanica]|uniref:Uncharacterized protein n=1 Tax=Thalassiosira oceanica TaxID=159749 RepID=K0TBC4_THAOC|nr:hypothetical protein THAOC_02195 [Thalassiosira oceanica]|eukprot:EJK76063.1 hypothetical protein THAOC_02195 [Thalassiosira oceanica]